MSSVQAQVKFALTRQASDITKLDPTTINKEFEELGIDQAAYEALEKDFQEVLQELVGDQSLERFRIEYEKLHRALKTSYESEKRLIKKCKELNDIIYQNTHRVKAAIKLTQDDAHTIGLLKKEVDKAWKLVEQAKEKEEKARKIIQELKDEIARLHKVVDQGSGLSIGQDNTVHELMKSKEDLKRDNDTLREEGVKLTQERDGLNERIAKLESDILNEKSLVEGLKKDLQKLSDEKIREERMNKMIQSEKHNLLEQKAKNEQKIKELEEEVKKKETEKEKLNERIKEHDSKAKLNQERIALLETDLAKQQQTNVQMSKDLETLYSQVSALHEDLTAKKDNIIELEKSNNSLNKENSKLKRKNELLAKERDESEGSKNLAKSSMSHVTQEIEYLRKQAEMDTKQIEELIRERDILTKNVHLAEENNKKQNNKVSESNTIIQSLNNQIQGLKKEIQGYQKQIFQLEKEKDKYGQEASKANAHLLQLADDYKLKKNLISELKKENIEYEGKLKQQQNLYEAVRSDRNLYSKNLIEAQDEVAELKRKFKIATHQISQLKDEIDAKDAALTSEHYELSREKKNVDNLKAQLGNLDKKLHANEEDKKRMEIEIEKLKFIIKEAEDERQKQKKDYELVINERDILGTQLIRRNDELALLYEKIKILQSTLAKGEVQYQERLGDIRLLKFKIGDLNRELGIVKKQASVIGDLKKEVYHLQQQLLQERLQVKALSEELENPLNFHRWRKLEGTDPDTFEMLQKIQTLQRRLISKTEECVEKDVVIQEKEKLYIELKNLLARQPGPEVAEQLSIYQQNLKEKTSQMKAMAAELNMYQAQVNEYKYEIERLTRELQDMKRRYYEQKRREQLQREAQQKLEQPKTIKQTVVPSQRFTGGGFNLAVGQ